MADKINLELDESFINKLFEITDKIAPPLNEIDLSALKKQLRDIGQSMKEIKEENEKLKSVSPEKREQMIKEMEKKDTQREENTVSQTTKTSTVQVQAGVGIPMNYNQPTLQFIDPSTIKREHVQQYDDNGQPVKGKVLIIDDLGIITYQLSVILKRAGYLPITSKEIYDALDKYKRGYFDFVIMDLFLPTEREGFILLQELKKIAKSRKENTIIAVMSASSKKEHKQECQRNGAAFYVEKIEDWQKELYNMFLQYENQT